MLYYLSINIILASGHTRSIGRASVTSNTDNVPLMEARKTDSMKSDSLSQIPYWSHCHMLLGGRRKRCGTQHTSSSTPEHSLPPAEATTQCLKIVPLIMYTFRNSSPLSRYQTGEEVRDAAHMPLNTSTETATHARYHVCPPTLSPHQALSHTNAHLSLHTPPPH